MSRCVCQKDDRRIQCNLRWVLGIDVCFRFAQQTWIRPTRQITSTPSEYKHSYQLCSKPLKTSKLTTEPSDYATLSLISLFTPISHYPSIRALLLLLCFPSPPTRTSIHTTNIPPPPNPQCPPSATPSTKPKTPYTAMPSPTKVE